ncbi:MAG: endonuclease III domain-containing protein [Candidatus Omnitrophica bacterium]|nr:endonuclease III domain-containing protein [Candidatus Omnitrophota bacterium]
MIKYTVPLIFRILFKSFGPQGWWPGKTRFEVIVGAILTQNTAWSNVEKAIKNLRSAKLLNLKALSNIPSRKLYPLLRPSGYYRIKTKRLKSVVNFLCVNYQANLNQFFKMPLEKAREELLSVNGIGPETADSILLYAGKKPVFVVDAYTRRIFECAGIVPRGASYEDIQRLFMKNLPRDTQIYNEYHALIVRLGKDICKTKPQCSICPLGPQRKQRGGRNN